MYASVMRDRKLPIGSTLTILDDIEDMTAWVLQHVHDASGGNEKSFHAEITWGYDASLHDEHYQLPYVEQRSYSGGLINRFDDFKPQLHSAERIAQCLSFGLHIVTCTKIIEFEQEYIFTDYITKCLDLRKLAKQMGDDSLDGTAKLAGNSTYGKTMENVNKYEDIHVTDEMPAYVPYWNLLELTDGVKFVHANKGEVKSDKTPHMGFAILEHSKHLFYQCIYDVLTYFGNDVVELMYCDTDSALFVTKQIPNLWEVMLRVFPDHFYEGEKRLGMWELEKTGNIEAAICLSAKQYIIKAENMKIKHKGVPSKFFDASWLKYYRAAMEQIDIVTDLEVWERRHYQVVTRQTQKIALSYRNNKRISVEPAGRSIPFGYQGKLFDNGSSTR